ncbi:fused response regulator/phosphatase [Actinacidiphila acididurans]|uniref:SpoIIE family protein phosphatase n=1 Tax=Actinacidiphila acididurans TaxID=2784346 RepID=A0ABS2TY75_9ACTN|nr:SpoIIE family protein phosphatase [Actinacidiphila acididurans]MBM9507931.1 SpoIIE family protein phosphatase [Actinacidiphila acididurans]
MDGYFAGSQGGDGHPEDLAQALLEALAHQRTIGIVLLGPDLRVSRSSVDPDHFHGLVLPPGCRLTDAVPPGEAEALTARLRKVQGERDPLLSHRQRIQGEGGTVLSLSVLPLPSHPGKRPGLIVAMVDATRETRRLDLLFDAAAMIGASLDVADSAQQLADALAPGLGDEATVYLVRKVFAGEEPAPRVAGGELGLRCAAMAPADRTWPDDYIRPGMDLPRMPSTPAVRRFQRGDPYILPDLASIAEAMDGDPQLLRRLVPPKAKAVMQSALLARGLILGGVSVWRDEESDPFTDDDLRLLQEVTSRAALSIDNARRYTRERTASVALQRSLLPPAGTDTSAVEAAGVYLPATAGGQGAGGDWYDVIPLSSLRVALVVGDVAGHGLRATATMGRLRTAVQALADLDLGPGELLTHLDDLVLRIGETTEPSHEDVLASTLLYAVYDPVARRCTMASAGHPPPGIVRPDGTFAFVDVDPGPPLGVGGLPFEDIELEMAPGSLLVLYTDGLVEHGHDGNLAVGMDSFGRQLAALRPDTCDLQATASGMVEGITPAGLADDVTLLLARVRATPESDVATWRIPDDPAAVTSARDLSVEQLTAWGLADLAFTTELIVSELVTNAIRHAGGPIELRLIRDARGGTMVCEVSDPSNTQPRLRQARSTDEGGRGLFLVAQLATRWGSRYKTTGKTIWAEQTVSETG